MQILRPCVLAQDEICPAFRSSVIDFSGALIPTSRPSRRIHSALIPSRRFCSGHWLSFTSRISHYGNLAACPAIPPAYSPRTSKSLAAVGVLSMAQKGGAKQATLGYVKRSAVESLVRVWYHSATVFCVAGFSLLRCFPSSICGFCMLVIIGFSWMIRR